MSETFFLPFQSRWIKDQSDLKIVEKSRQVGFTWATAYSAVRRVAERGARLDVWVSSRDNEQAKLFLEDCKKWAGVLQLAADDLGEVVIEPGKGFTAFVLKFATGLHIYSLSSNPNALAGKRGHVILDEFALHQDQRLLYRVAKPVTTWGGQLEIISTHRGVGTVFNEIIRDIAERGNPMGWSHHKVTIHDAVEDGLVERVNAKTGKSRSREDYLAKVRAECLDEEQWQQEYCCVPADEGSAFISYEMVESCRMPMSETPRGALEKRLMESEGPLYVGVDVGRKRDLTVIDIGELQGDVMWDVARVELSKVSFSEQEEVLNQILYWPTLRRACMDATGLGMQMAERARERFGWRVEPVTFTGPVKEALAFPLRAAFEDRRLRLDVTPALLADLRGVKKETTSAGNIRFGGEVADSHCDRFWALALKWHAAFGLGQEAGAIRQLRGGHGRWARARREREVMG